MAFGDADLDMMLGDVFSEPVVYGTQSARGIFTRAPATLLDTDGIPVQRIMQTVDVATGALSGVVADTVISVGGTTYRVRDTEPVDDGRITRIHLAGGA